MHVCSWYISLASEDRDPYCSLGICRWRSTRMWVRVVFTFPCVLAGWLGLLPAAQAPWGLVNELEQSPLAGRLGSSGGGGGGWGCHLSLARWRQAKS